MTQEEVERTDKIRVRCTRETRREFKTFVAENDFAYQEDAIKAFLKMAKENPDLFKKSRVRYV